MYSGLDRAPTPLPFNRYNGPIKYRFNSWLGSWDLENLSFDFPSPSLAPACILVKDLRMIFYTGILWNCYLTTFLCQLSGEKMFEKLFQVSIKGLMVDQEFEGETLLFTGLNVLLTANKFGWDNFIITDKLFLFVFPTLIVTNTTARVRLYNVEI